MTEGTPADFAVEQDVADRWRPLTADEQQKATTRLGDASALLRTLVPGIDARVAVSPVLADVVRSSVVDVVIRFLQNPTGAKSLQETIGPRAYGMTFDGRPTGIFFTEGELAALRPSAGRSPGATAMGTAFVGIRPGWGPLVDPCRPGWWPYP